MNKQSLRMERQYHIPLAMFDDAFRAFQKKYVYPQNIVFTVVLLAIAGVYVHAVVKDNTQTLAYLLIVACIALIMSRWYKTFKLRRSVHDALKDVEQDEYLLRVYDDGLEISTKDAPAEETAKPAEPEPAEESPAEPAPDGSGFNALFPEKAEAAEPIPPTEIPFGTGVKIHEFADYFMVYIVKQNFYVIPKKDFTETEISELKALFKIEN